MTQQTDLRKLSWQTARVVASLLADMADDLESGAGKSLEVFGKLNSDGELYIKSRQKEQRADAAILREFAKNLMRSAQ